MLKLSSYCSALHWNNITIFIFVQWLWYGFETYKLANRNGGKRVLDHHYRMSAGGGVSVAGPGGVYSNGGVNAAGPGGGMYSNHSHHLQQPHFPHPPPPRHPPPPLPNIQSQHRCGTQCLGSCRKFSKVWSKTGTVYLELIFLRLKPELTLITELWLYVRITQMSYLFIQTIWLFSFGN